MNKHIKLEIDLIMDKKCIDKFIEYIDNFMLPFTMDLTSILDTSEILATNTISIIENSKEN